MAAALQDAADEDKVALFDTPIVDIIKSWTEKPGYPLVTVDFDMSTSVLTISQVELPCVMERSASTLRGCP